MLFLDAAATRAALSMPAAIEAMRLGLGDDREVPLRSVLGGVGFMPGRAGRHTGVKAISFAPGNPVGFVLVFGPEGEPLGLVDGPTLTAIRTGAASGLATDLLAPVGDAVLAMLGAGVMADDQIAAVASVRSLTEIRVWSRDQRKAVRLADKVGGTAIADVTEAISGASIINTATPATEPLFADQELTRQVHINAVGSHSPARSEVPAEFVRRAFVVVDDLIAAAAEAGDVLQAGVKPDCTLAEIIAGTRSVPDGDTFFKSVGIASQDVAAGVAAIEEARRRGLGAEI
jgi:ornithine cyclodeaminase